MEAKIKNFLIRYAFLLEIFRGLDQKIFLELPKNLQKFIFYRTLKEIETLSKINPDYNDNKFKNFLQSFLKEKKSQIITLELSSLLEFGKNLKELNDYEKKIVKRKEILQEINHFSRIMFLDSILNSKNVELTKEKILREVWDFTRFLILLAERKRFRDNLNIDLKPTIELFEKSPLVVNLGFGDYKLYKIDSVTYILKSKPDLSKDFYNFLRKFPIKIAVCIFDYYVFLLKFIKDFENLDLNLLILYWQNHCEGNNQISIYYNFDFSILFFNAENKNFSLLNFEKSTHKILKNLNPLHISEIFINSNKYRNAIIFLDDTNDFIKKINKTTLRKVVEDNRFNLMNGIRKFLSDNNTNPLIFQIKATYKKDNVINFSYLENLENKLVNEIKRIDLLTDLMRENINLICVETAHIHADRDVDENIITGIKVFNFLKNILTEHGFKIKSVAMIDELHVVNRLDYKKYLDILHQNNFVPDEIVFESSRIIFHIAIDILKILIKNAQTMDYKIFIKGDNLYFQKEEKTIELIEDIKNKFILGCVLFDIAFYVYKLNNEEANKIYNKINNLPPNFKLHEKMLDIYLQNKNPEERKKLVEKFLEFDKTKFTFDKIIKGLDDMPFLDLIYSLQKNKDKIIINIHEVFYRPQQLKFYVLFKTLGFPMFYTIFFDLVGNLRIEAFK
jgi:hypothetical protein